jgi:hypothetical protein
MATTKMGILKIRASFRVKQEAEGYKRELPPFMKSKTRIKSRRSGTATYYDVWTP